MEEIENKKSRKKRRNTRKWIVISLVCVSVAAISVVACLNIFCVAKSFTVENNSPYDNEVLLEDGKIIYGKPILSFSEKKVEKLLRNKYPYVYDVNIDVEFPDKVSIEFIGSDVEYAIQTESGQYVYLNRDFRILEAVESVGNGVRVIYGIQLPVHDIGYTYIKEDILDIKLLDSVMSAAEMSDMNSSITEVSLEKKYNLSVVLDSIITVELGTSDNLGRKFAAAKRILIERNSPTVKANINVRDYTAGKYRIITD